MKDCLISIGIATALVIAALFTVATIAPLSAVRSSSPRAKTTSSGACSTRCSELARSTEDALTDAGLIVDDARIVEYSRPAKVFPGEDIDALEAPGVRITITRLIA